MAFTPPPGNQVGANLRRPRFTGAGNQVGVDLADIIRSIEAVGFDALLFGTAEIAFDDTLRVQDATLGDALAWGDLVVVPGQKTILADGFGTLVHGTAVVINQRRFLSPSGWSSMVFGSARAYRPQIFPVGFSPGVWGTAVVRNFNQIVTTTGFDALLFGTAWISHFSRNVVPTGVKVDAYGTAALAGGIREVNLTSRGISSMLFGSALSVTLGVRQVYPSWWVDTRYGTALLGYHRDVAPAGPDSSAFGAHDVRDNRLYLEPIGIEPPPLSVEHAIGFYTRELRAAPIEPGDFDRWTPPRIHNLLQIVHAEYREYEWIAGNGAFGDEQIMAVRNVNRVVDLVGNGMAPPFLQVPLGAEVANNAVAVAPAGFDASAWPRHLVAPFIREIYPAGADTFQMDRFTVVYNNAAQLLPIGWDAAALGVPPLVVNTRRYFSHIGIGDQLELGTPFIAPRVREIAVSAYLEPVGGRVGDPTVWFQVRTIAPTPPPFGWGSWFGQPAFDTRWNLVKPASIDPIDGVSREARVRNVTPEVRPYWDSESFTLWGRAGVRNEWERYDLQGWDSLAVGIQFVEYRNKTIPIPGFDAHRPNLLHQVRNVDPDPPGVQYAIGATLADQCDFGSPSMSANSLYPPGIDADAYGTATVVLMGIQPEGIGAYADPDTGMQVGIPTMSPRTTRLPPISLGDTSDLGKPDFMPRTIWAPAGAPLQARTNHPPGLEERMDSSLSGPDGMPVFGEHTVELKNRVVGALSVPTAGFYGQPTVYETPLYVRPLGARMTLYGLPDANGGDKRINVVSELPLDGYGNASVTIREPFIRYLEPIGMAPAGIGSHAVSNFIRDLPAIGFDAMAFGLAHVQRPPPPATPPGLDATLFGATMVAYRIRSVTDVGLGETMVMIYGFGDFESRMRVSSASYPGATVGDQLLTGTPTVDRYQRTVYPGRFPLDDGVVPIPALRRQNRVNVPGNGPFDLWGDTWAIGFEPGTILPRGINDGAFGTGALHQRVRGAGFDAAAFGQAHVLDLVGAQGWDAAQFGRAVVIGFGCGARVRAVNGFDTALFGAPAINQLGGGGG